MDPGASRSAPLLPVSRTWVTSTRADGQGETEGAARAHPVLRPNSSAVTLDGALGDE